MSPQKKNPKRVNSPKSRKTTPIAKTAKPIHASLSFRVDQLPGWIHPETAAAVARLAARRGTIVWPWAFGRGERAVLRHRKPIPVSQWAEQHRVIHDSSWPGHWRNQVTAYAVGIMDAAFFPSVQMVNIMKCPQSAGTEAVHNYKSVKPPPLAV